MSWILNIYHIHEMPTSKATITGAFEYGDSSKIFLVQEIQRLHLIVWRLSISIGSDCHFANIEGKQHNRYVYGFLSSHHQGFLETGNNNYWKSLLIHWWPSPNMAYMQVFTLAHISHGFYPPSLLSDFRSSSPACCVGQSPPIISPIRITISEFLYTKYRSSIHHITINYGPLWSYITILPPYHLP